MHTEPITLQLLHDRRTTLLRTAGRTFPEVPGWADDLASLIATDGIGRHEALAADVGRRARRAGASAVLTDIVTDPDQPAVARERALGRLLRALAGAPRTVRVDDAA